VEGGKNREGGVAGRGEEGIRENEVMGERGEGV